MILSEKELINLSEGNLLTVVRDEWTLNNPGKDAYKHFAGFLMCSVQQIRNYEAGHGHMGKESWKKLEAETGTKLIRAWHLRAWS